MYSSAPSFDSSFVLNDPGSSSTSPSRLPKYWSSTSVQPEHARLERRRQHGLHHRLTGFKSLRKLQRCAPAQAAESREYPRQVRRAIRERHATGHRSPGIEHRRRNCRVIGFHRFDKLFRCRVHSSGFIYTSVEPHQHVTSRDTRLVLRKFSMSSLICSARSYLLLPS